MLKYEINQQLPNLVKFVDTVSNDTVSRLEFSTIIECSGVGDICSGGIVVQDPIVGFTETFVQSLTC